MAKSNFNGYSIVKEENGGFSVYQNGKKCDNAKNAMREIAAIVGLEIDPAWSTRQLGAKLQKAIGCDDAAPNKATSSAKPETKESMTKESKAEKPKEKTTPNTTAKADDKTKEMEDEIKRLKAELAKAKSEEKPNAEKSAKKSNDPFDGLMVEVCAGMYVQKYYKYYHKYISGHWEKPYDKRKKEIWKDTIDNFFHHSVCSRRVTVGKPFLICKYPVTQGQWKIIMGEGFNPSHYRGDDNLPVESVTIEEVQDFLDKLNKLTGKKYRLPTEAEWQWAASGAAKDDDQGDWAGCKDAADLEQYAWFDKNSENKTHPVGQKKPNELGLYDMSGNVWEICSDKINYKAEESSWLHDLGTADEIDPIATIGDVLVIKGGAYDRPANNNDNISCQIFGNGFATPGNRFLRIGFRLALSKE